MNSAIWAVGHSLGTHWALSEKFLKQRNFCLSMLNYLKNFKKHFSNRIEKLHKMAFIYIESWSWKKLELSPQNFRYDVLYPLYSGVSTDLSTLVYYYSVKNSCSFKNFFRSGRRSRLIGYYIFSSFFLLSWLLSNSPCPQMHQFRLCLLSSRNTMMPKYYNYLTRPSWI